MVYKTKKTNRNKYSYSQKNVKKVNYRGGRAINELEQSQSQSQSQSQVPTLSSNLNSAVNLGASIANDVVSSGIEKLGKSVGIDVNKSAAENVNEITGEIKNVVNALNSPKGEELKKEAGELIKDSLEILEPSIKKAEEIISDGAKKLTETGTSMVMTVLNEFPPIFAATELSKAVTAGAQAGETIAELTTTGTEALKKLEEQQKKTQSLIEKGKNLFNNFAEEGNKYVADAIGSAQTYVDNYGKNIMKKNMTVKNINNTFKKYNNQATMIGGRISKSHSEFLAPYIKSSKIINKTKRRRMH